MILEKYIIKYRNWTNTTYIFIVYINILQRKEEKLLSALYEIDSNLCQLLDDRMIVDEETGEILKS